MKGIYLIPISAALLLAAAQTAYPQGFAMKQGFPSRGLGGVQPMAKQGPAVIPIDVSPGTNREVPAADPAHAQDPVFLKKLNDAANAVVWELYDQKVITSTNMRAVSPSLDAQGNVRALSISGDKFMVNGPIIFNGDRRTLKASVTSFR